LFLTIDVSRFAAAQFNYLVPRALLPPFFTFLDLECFSAPSTSIVDSMMDQPNGLGNGQADGHRNGNGGFSWRAAKQYLQVDDGAGTESEAESSYQGWSDNGW
jgi:hypothetical protein